MPRNYKTADEVAAALMPMISDWRLSGIKVLPSERELAVKTASSLMTVRKALRFLEAEKAFHKVGRQRILARESSKNTCALKVAYVTGGDEIPWFPVYQRLERKLQAELQALGANLRSIYTGVGGKTEQLSDELKKTVDVIIYAGHADNTVYPRIRTFRHDCLVIGIDEDLVGRLGCVVSLNNYQAGYLAAEKLLEHGATNPAIIYDDRGYRPFLQRATGFLEALADHRLATTSCAYSINQTPEGASWHLPEMAERICSDGHDGLFLFTDAGCQEIREQIRKYRKVPAEFRLITLNSDGICRQNTEPVTAVSHGINGIAQRIAEIVTAFSQEKPFADVNLIDAEFQEGTTL